MKNHQNKNMTHFGFKSVYKNTKTSMVLDLFNNIALKYDLMNDLMSFGIHRLWKRFLIYHSNVYNGCTVLDLAGGTGDLSIKFSPLVGTQGLVVLADINNSMIQIGRDKLRNLGLINNILYVQADAENLPFPKNFFDCVAISFGLRNFTDKEKALSSVYRILKSGGKLLILDFGVPTSTLIDLIYHFYSFHILPKIGKLIAQDSNSYYYLVESIRMHPNQETLKTIILNTGFNNVKYFNMTFGIVVLHCAYKS